MINVVGLGYIGLPTALMLATSGQCVIGTDTDAERVALLRSGSFQSTEKGFPELYRRALEAGIRFETEYPRADVYIVAVPTPYLEETKQVDASYVVQAVKSVLQVCPKGAVIVVESTVSPGTMDRYIRPAVAEAGLTVGEDVFLSHAPERIIPGNMLRELECNNRTIGVDDPATGEMLKKLYSSFCHGRITVTGIRAAEMTKVAENTYRDINIAYANELAKVCRAQGLNVYEIIDIANQHPRVNILTPGPGVGGHCIPIDPWFLVGDWPELTKVIHAARDVNDSMPEYVLDRLLAVMQENGLSDLRRVGLYGLTYKADVDDVRDSPTLQLLQVMERRGMAGQVQVYDPFVSRELVANQHRDLSGFLAAIDLAVVLVDHRQLRDDPDCLKGKIILDTRRVYPDGAAYRL